MDETRGAVLTTTKQVVQTDVKSNIEQSRVTSSKFEFIPSNLIKVTLHIELDDNWTVTREKMNEYTIHRAANRSSLRFSCKARINYGSFTLKLWLVLHKNRNEVHLKVRLYPALGNLYLVLYQLKLSAIIVYTPRTADHKHLYMKCGPNQTSAVC